MLLMMGFYLSHFSFLSPVFSLHPSHLSSFPIFSGSSDHPPSLGCERLCSKLPPVCPDSQAREQVPCQICRWAVSVKSNTLPVKVCVCLFFKAATVISSHQDSGDNKMTLN